MDELLDPKVIIPIGTAVAGALGVLVRGHIRKTLTADKTEATLTEKLYADTAEIRKELWQRLATIESNAQKERDIFREREEELRQELKSLVTDNYQLKIDLTRMTRRVEYLEKKLTEHGISTNGG